NHDRDRRPAVERVHPPARRGGLVAPDPGDARWGERHAAAAQPDRDRGRADQPLVTIPSLQLTAPAGWTVRRLQLPPRDGAVRERELRAAPPGATAAILAGGRPDDVRRIGEREVAIVSEDAEVGLFAVDGEHAWVGRLLEPDPALIDAAAALIAGAATATT